MRFLASSCCKSQESCQTLFKLRVLQIGRTLFHEKGATLVGHSHVQDKQPFFKFRIKKGALSAYRMMPRMLDLLGSVTRVWVISRYIFFGGGVCGVLIDVYSI